jgi:hypothetical protein
MPEQPKSFDAARQAQDRRVSSDATIQELLALRFRDPDDPGLAIRRQRLRAAFGQLDSTQAGLLLERLKRGDRDPEYGRFTRLATSTQTELLNILERKVDFLRGTYNRGISAKQITHPLSSAPSRPPDPIRMPDVSLGAQASRLNLQFNQDLWKDRIRAIWKEPGRWPVKVVRVDRGGRLTTRGYITEHQAIAGQTPAQMEVTLGLPEGELSNGAVVQELGRLPGPNEFEFRAYTTQPGGTHFGVPGRYPPGTGVPQWEVNTDIPVANETLVLPGARYQSPTRYEPGPGSSVRVPVAERVPEPASPRSEPSLPEPAAPGLARSVGRAANFAAIALSLIFLYFGNKLARQEQENIKRGWKLFVAPRVDEKLKAVVSSWKANPESYPQTKTYLVIYYSISFEKNSHWSLGDIYLLKDIRYVSSVVSTSEIQGRIFPGPVTYVSDIDERYDGIPTYQVWAASAMIADP